MSESIHRDGILRLASDWIGAGKRVVGPAEVRPGLVLYTQLSSAAQLMLGGHVHPRNSIKEFFFPRHEKIYRYRLKGKQVELSDAEPDRAPQLILAARPCDVAALPVLDKLFNWDYKDDFYNQRRQASTLVSLACITHDDRCFCTSVGLGPAESRGSDAMLVDAGDGIFQVRPFTDRGRALFRGRTEAPGREGIVPPGPPVRFDLGRVARFLERGFESPRWNSLALTCIGCGACAYTCPSCHCFDIVDEGNTAGGARARNWDSCQFSLFTLHASGHNPRPTQAQRQRQRIYHKFDIYPKKFGHVLCTGCGNCTRNCPVSLGVAGVLSELDHA